MRTEQKGQFSIETISRVPTGESINKLICHSLSSFLNSSIIACNYIVNIHVRRIQMAKKT